MRPPSLCTAAFAAVLASSLLVALPAQAQAANEDWKFEATLYGWFPAIDTDLSFPISGGQTIGVTKDLSMGDVLSALKMAFFGTFEAKKGKYGFWTDLAYADLGGTTASLRQVEGGRIPIPLDVTSNLSLDLKTWIWTVAGTYNLVSNPDYSLDLVGGARMLDMTSALDYAFSPSVLGHPLGGRSGRSEVSETNWDAVVGVKGRAYFGDDRKWFVPYYVDIGTGQSQLTWQVNAGVGYQFGWGSVIATWRYLDYDFKSDSKIESMSLNGPTIGVAFRW
jgi:hypothetical protein